MLRQGNRDPFIIMHWSVEGHGHHPSFAHVVDRFDISFNVRHLVNSVRIDAALTDTILPLCKGLSTILARRVGYTMESGVT